MHNVAGIGKRPINQRWSRYWKTLLAILIIMVAAILSILWLKQYTDKAHTLEVMLLTVHRLTSEQNATEWQAIAQQNYSLELEEKIATIRSQLNELLVGWNQPDDQAPMITSVLQVFQQYQAAIDEEFRLLGKGDFSHARAMDEERVDPAFLRLSDALLTTSKLYQQRAQRANQLATYGTISTLGIAMLVLIFLIRHFEHLRQATLLMDAEQQVLRHSEEYFRTLVRNALDIIMISDSNGIIRYISPSSQRILGYPPDSLIGQPGATLAHADDLARVRHTLKDLSTSSEQIFTFEIRVLHCDGSWRFIEATAHNLLQNPNIHGIVFNAHDITERKIAEESLQYQAFHDPLTGLPNRALFLDRLQQALARTERQHSAIAILFLDFDNFKVINDSLGHEAGDQLLLTVAERLCTCVRPGDTVARLGGDEFTILLEDLTNNYPVDELVARIQASLYKPLSLKGQEVIITVSIGIALNTSPTDEPTELMRAADVAMYQAKAQGKAKSVFFEPYMDVHAKARLLLELELRRALEQDEICVYYQPIITMATGSIMGVEALVRWQHPQHGIVLPSAFMTVAEETGLIIPIGQRVIELACHQLSEWQQQYPDQPPLRLNINLSARQFQHPTLIADIQCVIEATGLSAQQLEFEITESLLLEDNARTRQTLDALKKLGVHLALDDFGTGYSSLAYLYRLPIDTVKIDRSFINHLGVNTEAISIVNAVMNFAQTMKLQVTAEGIETDEQYGFVRNLGCQFGQGYYFTKPLPHHAISHLLAGTLPTYKPNDLSEPVFAL